MSLPDNIKGAYALPIMFIALSFVLLEASICFFSKRENYNYKETAANITILLGMKVAQGVFAVYVFSCLQFLYELSPFRVPQNLFGLVLAVIVVDFFYYWEHRILHTVPLFWAFHHVHHSSPWYNFSTSFRLNWFSPLTTPLFFAGPALLGFSPGQILGFFALNLLYQFFLHTESIGKLGLLENILNTPSNHRVHHGSNDIYLDKNFGGILIIWDRLFGTYQSETEKVIYGSLEGYLGHNPLKAVFYGFYNYFCKFKARQLPINKIIQRVYAAML